MLKLEKFNGVQINVLDSFVYVLHGFVPPLYIVGILGASITGLPASHQIVILNWKWTPMKLSKGQGY